MNDLLMRLFLMDADDGKGGSGSNGGNDDNDAPKGNDEGGEGAPEGKPNDKTDDKQDGKGNDDKVYVKMTQAEIDAIVKERLDRDRKKREKEAEEKKKKEQGKFEELLIEKEQELERLQNELKAKEVDGTKTRLLIAEGYTTEQSDIVKKLLEGETEEEIKLSLESVKAHVPPKTQTDGVDPVSKGNGRQGQPAPVNEEDYGRNAARRILERKKKRTPKQ